MKAEEGWKRLHANLYGVCPRCGAGAADMWREMHNGQLIAFYVCGDGHRYRFTDAAFTAPAVKGEDNAG